MTLRGYACRRRVKTDPLATAKRIPSAMLGRVMSVENWAEIRRLHRVEAPDGSRNTGRQTQRALKLPNETLGQLVEAYLQEDSIYVLARRFGIHRQTVARHLRRAGIQRRRSRSRPNQDQAASVPVPRST